MVRIPQQVEDNVREPLFITVTVLMHHTYTVHTGMIVLGIVALLRNESQIPCSGATILPLVCLLAFAQHPLFQCLVLITHGVQSVLAIYQLLVGRRREQQVRIRNNLI